MTFLFKILNVYAAHNYDRQHILEINNDSLQPIDDLSLTNDVIEEWTIDRDAAFEIGWNLTRVNLIQNLCLKQFTKQGKDKYHIISIRLFTDEETQTLICFPFYIIDYEYRNKKLQFLR
ncbi:unnamed protein product [Rotaria magnacalcarata]